MFLGRIENRSNSGKTEMGRSNPPQLKRKGIEMTREEMIKKEAEDHKRYERETVVTEHGETIYDLRKAYELVTDKSDSNKPWSAAVHHSAVGIVMRAIEFFHADRPEILGVQDLTGFVVMRGNGYQAY